MRNLCFVVPRYYKGIIGGAETLIGALAYQCRSRGDNVTILTTCAKDNRTWEDFFVPGKENIDGVNVERFSVDERNLDIWIPLQIKLSQNISLTIEEQINWITNSVNSISLYSRLVSSSSDYDAIFFGPYLFGITFWGSMIIPEKSWLIPCLHDEQYAYTDIMSLMFNKVKGCLFNTRAEQDLAFKLYGKVHSEVVGMGFDNLLNSKFKSESLLADGEEYILYLGRKETGKNLDLLIDLFNHYKSYNKKNNNLKLVIAGGGSLDDAERTHALSDPNIIDLTAVSEDAKRTLLRDALALVQPSTNESFSIVMLESWIEKTPCIVNKNCPVTYTHVADSMGGLYFQSASEFCGAIDFLIEHEGVAKELGNQGREYVQNYYCWNSVIDRLDEIISS